MARLTVTWTSESSSYRDQYAMLPNKPSAALLVASTCSTCSVFTGEEDSLVGGLVPVATPNAPGSFLSDETA